ncbi:unnamed protein product [Protopolystoma xenopodis]|uniref:Uncharacterized protein n=1 Tax=Protopolystoma xenopodis TaxID=117903 RepID=A0A448WK48_9PLAT|nr:unnamed protein product [Protopolystoma xenopodis]
MVSDFVKSHIGTSSGCQFNYTPQSASQSTSSSGRSSSPSPSSRSRKSSLSSAASLSSSASSSLSSRSSSSTSCSSPTSQHASKQLTQSVQLTSPGGLKPTGEVIYRERKFHSRGYMHRNQSNSTANARVEDEARADEEHEVGDDGDGDVACLAEQDARRLLEQTQAMLITEAAASKGLVARDSYLHDPMVMQAHNAGETGLQSTMALASCPASSVVSSSLAETGPFLPPVLSLHPAPVATSGVSDAGQLVDSAFLRSLAFGEHRLEEQQTGYADLFEAPPIPPPRSASTLASAAKTAGLLHAHTQFQPHHLARFPAGLDSAGLELRSHSTSLPTHSSATVSSQQPTTNAAPLGQSPSGYPTAILPSHQAGHTADAARTIVAGGVNAVVGDAAYHSMTVWMANRPTPANDQTVNLGPTHGLREVDDSECNASMGVGGPLTPSLGAPSSWSLQRLHPLRSHVTPVHKRPSAPLAVPIPGGRPSFGQGKPSFLLYLPYRLLVNLPLF